ncbi:MAG: hypothetical protein ACOYMR_05040 [Ilumatobacteraceae bacterium]
MPALIEQFKAVARIGLYLLIAFMIIQLWQDPHGAAQWTIDFIGSIGHFFAAAFDKVGEFVRGLGGKSESPSTTG